MSTPVSQVPPSARAVKFSQLTQLDYVPLNAIIPVSYDGDNFAITMSILQGLVTKDTLGLYNVNNTSDADKPLSLAAVTALSRKADKVGTVVEGNHTW